MDTNLESIFLKIQEQAESMSPIKAKMKFVMDDHIFLIDGTGDKNIISQDDIDANCTVKTDLKTFHKLKSGELNPIEALMLCKINIMGDMGLAFRLKSLLSS